MLLGTMLTADLDCQSYSVHVVLHSSSACLKRNSCLTFPGVSTTCYILEWVNLTSVVFVLLSPQASRSLLEPNSSQVNSNNRKRRGLLCSVRDGKKRVCFCCFLPSFCRSWPATQFMSANSGHSPKQNLISFLFFFFSKVNTNFGFRLLCLCIF